MEPTPPQTTVATLLEHATAAAHLLGHLGDPAADPIADHVDAMVHLLTELRGEPRAIDVIGAAAIDDRAPQPDTQTARPDDQASYDGMRRLTSGAGGVR